jgi:hypothetical protein
LRCVPFRWPCSTRPTGVGVTLPRMCGFHVDLYATKVRKLKGRVHHPGEGRKALEREARTVARQCPECPPTR